MEKVVREVVEEEPVEKEVVVEDRRSGLSPGLVVLGVILLLVILFLLIGNPFAGNGGDTDVNVQTPESTSVE